jgi:hypothetical protein
MQPALADPHRGRQRHLTAPWPGGVGRGPRHQFSATCVRQAAVLSEEFKAS